MKSLTSTPALSKRSPFGAFGVALLLWMCASGIAQAGAVPPSVTDLTSTADRMVSYRHQEHMWITEDTHTQLIYNRGDGLQLASSIDGVTWTPKFTFNDSNSTSTSDSVYKNGVLSVVYAGVLDPENNREAKTTDIRFARFTYDPDFRSWQLSESEIVRPTASGLRASNPTFVEDAQGNAWVAFLEQKVGSTPKYGTAWLRLYVRAKGSTTWVNSNETFGLKETTPLGEPKRSARLVRTPTGLGVVYSVGDSIYWSERNGDQPWTKPTAALATSAEGPSDTDPYASHFSLASDGEGFIHLVHTDGGKVFYRRFNPQSVPPAWSEKSLQLSQEVKAAYPQVSWLGGKKIAVVYNAHPADQASKLVVLQSANRGAKDSFVCTSYLTHPKPTSVKLEDGSGVTDGSAYKHMRSETPSVAPASGVPVLMQYELVENQVVVGYRAYAYRFPASSTEGCAN